MTLDFDLYIDEFNAGEDDRLVDKWFAEDFRYIGSNRTIEGRENWRQFMHFAHKGLREIYRPQIIVRQDGYIFCEHDMDFHALAPRPEFPFGPLMPGEMYTVKFFGLYHVVGDKFSQLTISTWPVGANVSRMPPLGGHVTQRAAFESLVAALSAGDHARAAKLFTPEAQSGDAVDRLIALAADGALGNGRDGIVADDMRICVTGAGLTLTLCDGLIAQVVQTPAG